MFKRLLSIPVFLGITITVISGALVFNHLFLQSPDSDQRLFLNSDGSLFIDNQAKIGPESPELTLIQENSVAGISCSQTLSPKVLGALVGGTAGNEKEITEHLVQPGETLSSIATDFDVSLNTILWANDLGRGSIIQPGQKLIILPVSGTIHHVKSGDTLSEIAEAYKGKTNEIVAFNDLSEEGSIYVGDILIVPNGAQPQVIPSQPYSYIPVASSYFIIPVSSPYRITQGLHWYNAIDFANTGESCGKPVYAAAGGEVLKVKYGYNFGAGNYIRILHPNGLITHYGHLQKILVAPGQKVSQGSIIGLIGCTGKVIPQGTAGCHLHFGLYSSQGNPPRNPFAR